MLLHEGNPTISGNECLEFSIPGFGRSTGRIDSWNSGFKASLVRSNEVIDSTHRTLRLFPNHPAHALPYDVLMFLERIPTEYCEFVSNYEFGQCPLLQLLARHPEAKDLRISNPTLLWLLTTCVFDSIIDAEEIPALLRRKQIEILARLSRRSTKASLKLLHKVVLVRGSLTESRTIIEAMGNLHTVKITAHLSSVPVALLRTVSRYPNLANPTIARILADNMPQDDQQSRVLASDLTDSIKDVYRMAEALRIHRPDEALSRCRTLLDLEQLHDRWVDRVNKRGEVWIEPVRRGEWPDDLDPPNRLGRRTALTSRAAEDCEFPDQPFPDSKDITAIKNANDLAYEGRLQRNCVGSYIPHVMSNEHYVYKVLRPHRATLELRNTPGGWQIGQLKLSGNRVPGAAVKKVVEEWFQDRRKELEDGSFAPGTDRSG